MPNANIIARNGALPGDPQGASSTAEFQFLEFALSPATPQQANVRVPPLAGKAFRKLRVRAGGRVTGGTTTNFTGKIYAGRDTTIGNNTLIATTGAVAFNSTSDTWSLEADIDIDSAEGSGTFAGMANNTAVARAALSNKFAASPNSEISFTVTGQFSASNASNAARLDFLEVEEV